MALRLVLDDMHDENIVDESTIARSRLYWKDPLPSRIAGAAKNSPGFQPTTIQARQIERLVALGMAPFEIAASLLIDLKLLEFYYKRELEVGAVLVNAKVGATALKMALSGVDPDMTKFWLKARAGWKETSVVEKKIEITEISSARAKLLGTAPLTIDNATQCVDVQWSAAQDIADVVISEEKT